LRTKATEFSFSTVSIFRKELLSYVTENSSATIFREIIYTDLEIPTAYIDIINYSEDGSVIHFRKDAVKLKLQ
jgi:hypothetical protein